MMYLNPQQRYSLDENAEGRHMHARRDLPAFVRKEAPLMENDGGSFETILEPTATKVLSPQDSDEEDSLRGIDIVQSDDEEMSTPKLRHKVLPSSPGILLPAKRAIAQKDHHERHVRFSPPSPRVYKPVGFFDKLESLLSKLQLACGSVNQVVDSQ